MRQEIVGEDGLRMTDDRDNNGGDGVGGAADEARCMRGMCDVGQREG